MQPLKKKGENTVFVLQADDVTNYGWNFMDHFLKRRLFIGIHIRLHFPPSSNHQR